MSRALIPLVVGLLLTGCSQDSEPSPNPVTTPEPQLAPVAQTRPDLNLDERGRALRGYDPVAYFKESRAVAGREDLHVSFEGADYFFVNEEHHQAFVDQPQRYLPAHGGFCTFGIVLEKKFDGDPEVWLIDNNELHIFLNQEVRGKFLSDKASNFARVEANWPGIQDKTPEELENGSVGS